MPTVKVSVDRLTAYQHDDLTDGHDSDLHYHPADRDRANHTGTQTADTISDFTAAVVLATPASSGSGSISRSFMLMGG